MDTASNFPIFRYDCVESTNTLAKQMAAQGAAHGTVLIADRQTGGRGRMGRSFHSPAGMGIYMSMILRMDKPAQELMHLTCAAAVAAADAIEEVSGIRPGIKWINDLVWENRKLAGILTELILAPDGSHAQYAIIGIGINCHQRSEDFPEDIRSIAVSLDTAAGRRIRREHLIDALIEKLEKMAGDLENKATIMATYRKSCVTVGKEIRVHRLDSVTSAFALDVDDDGSLIVRFSDGSIRSVNSGEVSVRGMYGYN